jgi:hypothetical protein
MAQPSQADVRKLAPFPQLRQACQILVGREQARQKLCEFFVYKNAVAYKPDEGRRQISSLSRSRRTQDNLCAYPSSFPGVLIIVLLP